MDFYKIKEKQIKGGGIEVYPDFQVLRSKDLMIRGRAFYAIWDERKSLWSTDEYDVQRLVDEDLEHYRKNRLANEPGINIKTSYMGNFESTTWLRFRNYIAHLSDAFYPLDDRLTWINSEVSKNDYVSRRLPYSLSGGDTHAYDELVSTLYDPSERAKLEWAIGAIVSGDSRDIQKFVVLYGSAGTGKSTVLNIVQSLFDGYYTTFEAKALTGASNSFATEVFRSNPLVAIQHDGDLSRIEDNTKLNSIISHEEMTMNEKYKASYTARINSFLFMGTNKPVKITDSKSGIIRRLIDVRPSGRLVSPQRYQLLMSQIQFELGAIAAHCLEVYRSMGKNYYAGYRPVEMMLQTDVFFNFIETYYDVFAHQDGVTLQQAYDFYKLFCEEALVEYRLARHKFRDELKNYFHTFEERAEIDGVRVRSWYGGFVKERFTTQRTVEEHPLNLVLDKTDSLLDRVCANQPAQYANDFETPSRRWDDVDSTLYDLDTSRLHYVKLPTNHIVIDFDLKDEEGNKSAALNLEAASIWPPTYAEYSKGGGGIHLHYLYDGDVDRLSRLYSEGIEIKVFVGNASLRRRVSFCNDLPIATLNSGLPLKEKKMIASGSIMSERALRDLIMRNLRKEIHSGTKPSIDFIHKILEDAYNGGMRYDVRDLRGKVLAFANNSTNQSEYCIKLVMQMRFVSDAVVDGAVLDKSGPIIFFDVEVFPNLFVVCWKAEGTEEVVRMLNPTSTQVAELMRHKLVGFNCRRYDNHILYARYMGYDNEQLYKLSQKIINGNPNAFFGEAYDVSYTDIYDFSSIKKGLKRFQIDLGISHKELGLPWDLPVPEEMWPMVAEYCDNDVISTEVVFEDRKQDFVARQILARLSGLSVNHTTQQHTAKIIFGNDKEPQKKFVYTDLSEEFPGYTYDGGVSTYRGEVTGEGGLVYAEPGMYENVALLDIASMHPTTIEVLDLFGPYTQKFSGLLAARLAIKHKQYAEARMYMDGALGPFLTDEKDADALAYALKIVINIVYGLTSASFNNPFRDPRNKDNIVAKRGALFMIDLKHFVQEKGYQVAHIKTDSIKIVGADEKIIDLVMEFGISYGYTFEHEATYEKFCLVNDAVYIAKTLDGRTPAHWVAVGAQFQHPYVFKSLFSKERLEFSDMCEAKTVKSAMYLDMNSDDKPAVLEEDLVFVGRAGLFCPVTEGGGVLYRKQGDKYHAVTGTKGYRWLEAEMVKVLHLEKKIDQSYFSELVDTAITTIGKFGDPSRFLD